VTATIEEGVDWIEAVDTRAMIDKEFSFKVLANTEGGPRDATIIFKNADASEHIVIKQAGKELTYPAVIPDKVLKTYIMTNFDTNKDGEISKEEAEAQTNLAKAKEEADEIVRQAQENADAIRQQAQEDGYQTGLEQGRIEAQEELQKQSEAFTQEMDQKRAELEEQEKKLEPAFAELVVSLVRKITGISCENKKDIILYLIGNSLRNIEKTSHITIRVSKEDISRVAAKKSTLKAIAKDSAELEVVEDSSLEAMQCIIETDHSMIDCSLDAQLQNLEDHVKLLLY
jgi:flagellar biosynthesis/type III secretory pathway protein FliH